MSAPGLRFLADESCDHAVVREGVSHGSLVRTRVRVRALRSDGWDVVAIAESAQRSVDRELIDSAWRDRRIVLTEDKDFGWLVHVSHATSPGVVLIRFPGNARRALVETIRKLVSESGDQLVGAFAVVQPGHVRIEPRPAENR